MALQRGQSGTERTRTKYSRLIGVLSGLTAFALIVFGGAALYRWASARRAVTFTDARRQAAEFISYDRSISLTPVQKEIMDQALSSIPAPCCDQFSIATCCCPCNLAKSTWGLSKFLIAKQQATATQVRAAAAEWLQFTNPGGYTGDACFTKGCNRPFEANGCGGMDDRHIQ